MSSNNIRQPNVLIIDDEPDILDTLRLQLRTECIIFLASGANEGLSIMAEHNIDVVLCDQRMPGMTGDIFLERVQQSWPRAKLILITGYSDIKAIANAVNNAHIYAYIEKPWIMDELRCIVNTAYRASIQQSPVRPNTNALAVASDIISEISSHVTNNPG